MAETDLNELPQIFEDQRDEYDVAADIVDASMDAIACGDVTPADVVAEPFKNAMTAFHHGIDDVDPNTDIRVPLIIEATETAIRREYGDEPLVRDA